MFALRSLVVQIESIHTSGVENRRCRENRPMGDVRAHSEVIRYPTSEPVSCLPAVQD